MKIVKTAALSILWLLGIMLAIAATQKSTRILRPMLQGKGNNLPHHLTSQKNTFVETQTTLPVVATTYLDGPNGNTNYSSNPNLVVKQTNASNNTYNRLSLLKFDLSSIDETKGRIIKAELQLFIKSTDAMNSATKRQNFDDTPYIIGYSREDAWNEGSVTWNNYANYAQSAGEISRIMGNQIPYSQTNGTNWAIIANSKVSWDITNGLRKDYFNDQTKTLSLVLTSTSVSANMGATFHSKENGNPAYQPRLVIYQASDISFTLPEDNEATVYDKIMDNIRKTLYDDVSNYSTISTQAQNYLNSITGTGAWTDILYTSTAQTNWEPIDHLNRLKTMTIAYTSSQSSLFKNNDLYNAIINGLQYWQSQNPTSTNWYNQQIASPQRVGQILIMMRNADKKVPVMLELNMISRMKSSGGAPDQSGSQGTGANKLNIAIHWIYRGCLAEDKAVLDKGVEQAFYPMFLTTGEGLQYDYSYLQHGRQLYIGGYGWDIVSGITGVGLYTIGTSYSLADEKLEYLSSFVRQAYLRAIRGQHFMFNAFGRGVARPNGSNQSGFATLLNRMKVVDPNYAAVYNAAIARLNNSQAPSYGIDPVHSHFYSSDYTLLTKPEYTFELRMVSTRTLRNENGNGENLKGYFLSDGATAIATTGTEYSNIYPTWNWSMIPGTTARNGTMVTPAQWGTAGNTSFVGGVSDTLHGLSVYDLNNNNTQAKKAWFFFDDEVVCLGAGINASGTQEVNTTLNQCLLQSEIITSTVGGVVNTYNGTGNSIQYNNDLEWAVQGNVGYVFPSGGNVGLTAATQTGKWSTINSSESTADVSQDVFTLWLKHGVAPSNGSYSYIVVPNISNITQMQHYLTKSNIQILQNTNQVQAVKHKNLNLHGFVFHSANQTFANDTISVTSDQACLVMIQPMPNGKLKLHIADPTTTQTAITLNIKWTGDNVAKQVMVNLPSGVYAGKSVVAYVSPENVLPLKLLNFNAKRGLNGVDLKWTTSNEVNTEKIEVWRRDAHNSNMLIGTINTQNSASGINNYYVTDKNASPAEQYYQLKFIDKDGASSLSDIKHISSIDATILKVYPNPTSKYLYVNINSKQNASVYNSMGQLMQQAPVSSTVPIEIAQYPTGIYYLKINEKTIKFVVAK